MDMSTSGRHSHTTPAGRTYIPSPTLTKGTCRGSPAHEQPSV